jgi:hypothetical protein
MKEEDREFLSQMVDSLEEAGRKLIEAYNKKDYENFSKSKKFILNIQNKISEIVE